MWRFPNSVPMSLMPFSPTFNFQFSSSWLFLRMFFSIILFQLPHIDSVTLVAFSQFVVNYFTHVIYTRCHIPSFPFFSTVSLLPFSNFFTNSSRIFPMWSHLFHSCHVHQLSNSQCSPRLFLCFSFFTFH